MDTTKYKELQNGIHYISGVGITTIDLYGERIEANLVCIDGTTFAFYIDPSDGYRSYGSIYPVSDVKCTYMFPLQKVRIEHIVKNVQEDEYEQYDEDYYLITDAVNGKEILAVGNTAWDPYYPVALFRYTPENMEINQGR